MVSDSFNILFLHDNWQLLKPCIDLLNSEWPRSVSARENSLRKCNPAFPLSLILIRLPFKGVSASNDVQLLGFAKLCLIPTSPHAVWIESVIVSKGHRGQGLGRRLMTAAEECARSKGFTIAYLSTHDQVAFYTKLGYGKCEPIVHIGAGAKLLQGDQFNKFKQSMFKSAGVVSDSASVENYDNGAERRMAVGSCANNQPAVRRLPAAPPPPPPPPPLNPENNTSSSNATASRESAVTVELCSSQFMKKDLF